MDFALKNPIRAVKRKGKSRNTAAAHQVDGATGKNGHAQRPAAVLEASSNSTRTAAQPLALPAPTATPQARLVQLHALLGELRGHVNTTAAEATPSH